jgi:peptide/nickel transport system substrate-binding protein
VARRQPFTAADVVFTWEYASDPATSAVSIGSYKDIKASAVDQYTVRVEYQKATAVLGRCRSSARAG